MAIRYGTGSYPGLLTELLLTNEVVPVCAPALLDGPRRLRAPQDIRHHTLLHDDTRTSDGAYPNWAMWLRAAGLEGVDPSRGPRFDYPGLVLEAAAAGARRRPGAEHRRRRRPRGRAPGQAFRGRRADPVRVLRRLPGSDGRATEGGGISTAKGLTRHPTAMSAAATVAQTATPSPARTASPARPSK